MRSRLHRLLAAVGLVGSLAAASFCQAAPPQWIWSSPTAAQKAPAGDFYFRKSFDVAEPETGELEISADNRYEVFVNGRNVGSGESWQQRTRYNIGPLLLPGRNLIAVRARNDGEDPAALMVRAKVKSKGKPAEEIVTDGSWRFATKVGGRWAVLDFSDEKWEKAHALGEYGKTAPWGPAGQIVAAKNSPLPSGVKSTEKGLFQLRDGDRVVLLGGTFIERLQTDGYFETLLTAALPHKHVTYRNLGWSGDTVWGDSRGVFGGRADGFKRLVSDVALCKPTVIVVCYGQNEAYAGEEGLADFEQGLNQLLDALEPTGARLLLLVPPPRFNVGPPLPDPAGYNRDLRAYSSTIAETAASRGHTFFDLGLAIEQELAEIKKELGQRFNIASIAENGVHLNDSRLPGRVLVGWLLGRETSAAWEIDLDASSSAVNATGVTVTDLAIAGDQIAFTAQPQLLNRRAVAGVLQIRNGSREAFELLVDGKPSPGTTIETAPSGVQRVSIEDQASSERFEQLRQVINQKNELFFHRYRPQNETYLFLFRKHEQGNNAVEIPMFDPLIEEKEKQIAELRQPLKQKFELRRVSK